MLSSLMISMLLGISPATADELTDAFYGSAPPSLDYPTREFGERKLSDEGKKKASIVREELSFLSGHDPFPNHLIPAVDPLTKKKVDRVLVGPAFRTRSYGSNYSHYRYVTFFDIFKRREQILSLPELHSTCENPVQPNWSSYGVTVGYERSIKAGVSIEGIGLDVSTSKSEGYKLDQGVATNGEAADYIPYAIKKDWIGSTHIQLLDSKTGKTKFLEKPSAESPWWVYAFFPLLAKQSYPYAFKVKAATWMFLVVRENVRPCPAQFAVYK